MRPVKLWNAISAVASWWLARRAIRRRHLTHLGGDANRIAKAVEWLRTHYDKPVRIEQIASELGMSVSGFHAQLKAGTAMSPLPLQKHIRLQDARRLMVGEHFDASAAGHRVGTTTHRTSTVNTNGCLASHPSAPHSGSVGPQPQAPNCTERSL
jgi:AraC-like DNA-binding protein